jgi:hypothetical protein
MGRAWISQTRATDYTDFADQDMRALRLVTLVRTFYGKGGVYGDGREKWQRASSAAKRASDR